MGVLNLRGVPNVLIRSLKSEAAVRGVSLVSHCTEILSLGLGGSGLSIRLPLTPRVEVASGVKREQVVAGRVRGSTAKVGVKAGTVGASRGRGEGDHQVVPAGDGNVVSGEEIEPPEISDDDIPDETLAPEDFAPEPPEKPSGCPIHGRKCGGYSKAGGWWCPEKGRVL